MSAGHSSRHSRIQARDISLLCDLYGHGVLNRDQIIALGFFTSVSRANARLKRLSQQSLVIRWHDDLHPGSQSFYLPTQSAAPLIARKLGADPQLLRDTIRHGVSPMTLRHAWESANVRIAFQRVLHDIHWLPERRCRH